MSVKVSDAQKIETLYNKVLGAATTASGAVSTALPSVSAAAKIIPSLQIFSDPIPNIAPSGADLTWDQTVTQQGNPLFKRWKSTLFPHIVKYEKVILRQEQFQESFNGSLGDGPVKLPGGDVKKLTVNGELNALDEVATINYLAQTIPFNYNKNYYAITVEVYSEADQKYNQQAADNIVAPWFYDKDAGYITFYGTPAQRAGQLVKAPMMTFWRYEGGFGFGSSGSGGTGATGARGPQGERGADGVSTGGGGGGTYANDTWLTTNLLGQPPAVVFGTPVSKSTAIYIPWSYPRQDRVGWAENVYLPNITKFTSTVITGPAGGPTGPVSITTDSSDVGWIRNNLTSSTPATMLVINKNPTPLGFTDIIYPGETTARKAYNYWTSDLSTKLMTNTVNMLQVYYSNPSYMDPSSSIVSFNKFSAGGAPTDVTPFTATVNVSDSSKLNLQWTAPTYADAINTSDGKISFYDIRYITPGSSIRYPAPIPLGATGSASSATSPAILTGLYPDAYYNVSVAAINDSGMTGAYTPLVAPVSTANLPEPPVPTTFSLDLTNARTNSGALTICKVSDNTPISYPLYTDEAINTIPFDTPIHRAANRGLLQDSGDIMELTVVLNNGTTNKSGPVFNFQGFPAPAITPTLSPSSATGMEITTTGVDDITPGTDTNDPKKGFYLKATGIKVKVPTNAVEAELAAQKEPYSITLKQGFMGGSLTPYAPRYFYYDGLINSVPLCTLSGEFTTITATNPTTISGISILKANSTIVITNAEASNMGKYFYRSPLVRYFLNGSATHIKQEVNLTNATGHASGMIADGSLKFTSSFLCDVNTYGSTITIGMVANNVFGSSNIATSPNSTRAVEAITDVPSNTLVYSTLADTVKTFATNTQTAGYRILTTNADNSLPTSASLYTEYLNTQLLTAPGYTNELLVANGAFLTPSVPGGPYYKSYTSTMGNSAVDYGVGQISINSTKRYASFCWKFPASAKAYKTLSFTINSLDSSPTVVKLIGGLLYIDGEKLEMFYAFKDPTNNTSSGEGTMNSVWMDANKGENPVGAGTYGDMAQNGLLGGSASPGVTLSGTTATVNAFIPLVGTALGTMLYLRIAAPLNKNIKFGAVFATVGGNV